MLKTVLLFFFVCSCIICSFGVSINNATLTRSKRQVGVNLGVGIVDAVKLAQENSGQYESHAGFTKGLMETIYHEATKGTEYGIMVYNMGQDYLNNLKDIVKFKTATHGGLTYGVWVFKCGSFVNKGSRGYRNWAYGHHCANHFLDGNGVNFYNEHCTDPSFRRTAKC